jgi:hypothetical protein
MKDGMVADLTRNIAAKRTKRKSNPAKARQLAVAAAFAIKGKNKE